VKNIVRELNNEKVDIIHWKPDAAEFLRDAFKPIKLLSVKVSPDKKSAHITVSEEDLSKAIGRRGQNARLTSRLVNMELSIEKDETAAEVFAAQMGSASTHLAHALGIDDATASILAENGLNDISLFADASVDDIAGIIGGNTDLAQRIFEKARELNAAHH
jgi:N utilization substance protein A